MAATSGTSDTDLKYEAVEKEFREGPFCFEFFQAVRLLQRLSPAREPVGRFTKPSDEVAHFGTHTSLSFPASQIQTVDWEEGQPPRLKVNFMGLTGPLGVLPVYYTQLLAERLREGDRAPQEFFDLFNHRIISLFYQAWEKYRFVVTYERGEHDFFSHYLRDLIGLGTPQLENRHPALADDSLLYYAGLLAQRPRSVTALQQILSDYFGVEVEIEQFAGAWYRLEPGNQCRFSEVANVSDQLGYGAVAGDEVWTQESRARIKLGPLTLSQYLDFLPAGTAFEPLRSLVKFFSNDEIDFEVQLILKREQVPPCELGGEGESAPRLGWVTWVQTKPKTIDARDTVLNLR
jgi:type VI secretion system protein ImpH